MTCFGVILLNKYPIPGGFHSALEDDVEKARRVATIEKDDIVTQDMYCKQTLGAILYAKIIFTLSIFKKLQSNILLRVRSS